MGAADKVVDPDVEAALSAIRLAISNETATGKTAPKGGAAVNAKDPGAGLRPELRTSRVTARTTTTPEEIVELRNKIAGHLDRITPVRPAAADQPPPRASGGFAGILSGETRLQETPPEPANPYEPEPYAYPPIEDYPGEASYPGPAESLRQPSRDVQEARWHEEPADYRPAHVPARAFQREPQPTGILSGEAAAATQAAFNQLAETLMARAMGERSVEEVTRELLRTMLKSWLDENLPPLVERLVREEIERVARRGPQR